MRFHTDFPPKQDAGGDAPRRVSTQGASVGPHPEGGAEGQPSSLQEKELVQSVSVSLREQRTTGSSRVVAIADGEDIGSDDQQYSEFGDDESRMESSAGRGEEKQQAQEADDGSDEQYSEFGEDRDEEREGKGVRREESASSTGGYGTEDFQQDEEGERVRNGRDRTR